jgi:hypothetical protein
MCVEERERGEGDRERVVGEMCSGEGEVWK